MNRRRALALTLAVVAVCAMTVGSMGFSSVSANRDVSVSVVDNENASIGVEACEMANTNSSGNNGVGNGEGGGNNESTNSKSTKVYVTNRYADSIDATAESSQKSIKPGHVGKLPVTALEDETVTVHASGDGIDATIHATVKNKADCDQHGHG